VLSTTLAPRPRVGLLQLRQSRPIQGHAVPIVAGQLHDKAPVGKSVEWRPAFAARGLLPPGRDQESGWFDALEVQNAEEIVPSSDYVVILCLERRAHLKSIEEARLKRLSVR